MNTKERISEIKQEVKDWKVALSDPACDFTTRTWIELQLIELRKEIRRINKEIKEKSTQ